MKICFTSSEQLKRFHYYCFKNECKEYDAEFPVFDKMKFWLVCFQILMIIVWPYLQKSLLTNWQWKVWRGRERSNVWQLHTWQTQHRWTNCTSIPSPCSLPPLPVGPPLQACVGWRFPAVMPKVLPLEPGVGLNIAMHALPTARNFFLLVLFSIVLVHSPSFFLQQWGTVDAEIKVSQSWQMFSL